MLANQATNYFVSGVVPTRMGNAHPNLVPYQPFPCSDGRVVIAVGNDGQFQTLCAALRADDLSTDAAYATNAGRIERRAALVDALSDRTRALHHGGADRAAGKSRCAVRTGQHHRPGVRRPPGPASRPGGRSGRARIWPYPSAPLPRPCACRQPRPAMTRLRRLWARTPRRFWRRSRRTDAEFANKREQARLRPGREGLPTPELKPRGSRSIRADPAPGSRPPPEPGYPEAWSDSRESLPPCRVSRPAPWRWH